MKINVYNGREEVVKKLQKREYELRNGKCENRFYYHDMDIQLYEKNEGLNKIDTICVNVENDIEHFKIQLLLEELAFSLQTMFDEKEADQEELEKGLVNTKDGIESEFYLSSHSTEYYREMAIDTLFGEEEENEFPQSGTDLGFEEQEIRIKDEVAKNFRRGQKNNKIVF